MKNLLARLLPLFLLIFQTSFFTHCSTSSDDLVGKELQEVYPVPDLLRTSTLESDLKFIELYEAGSYEDAFETFENNKPSAHSEFYKGLIRIYQSNPRYEEALAYLSDPLIKGSVYEQPARYYLALLHLGAGSMTKGVALLKEIAASNYHFKRRESIQILEYFAD